MNFCVYFYWKVLNGCKFIFLLLMTLIVQFNERVDDRFLLCDCISGGIGWFEGWSWRRNFIFFILSWQRRIDGRLRWLILMRWWWYGGGRWWMWWWWGWRSVFCNIILYRDEMRYLVWKMISYFTISQSTMSSVSSHFSPYWV